MIDTLHITYTLGFTCLLLAMSLLTGKLASLAIVGKNRAQGVSIGTKLFTGMLIQVSLVAIWFTKGATLLLPVIPLLVFYLRAQITAEPEQLYVRSQPITFFFIILATIAAWVFFAQLYLIPAAGQAYRYQSGDILFYSRVGDYIKATSLENNKLDYLYPHRYGAELYHYGDIWLIALCSTYFPINTLLSPNLIAFPAVAVVAMTGLYEYSQSFTNSRGGIAAVILSSALLLFSGFRQLYPSFIGANVFSTSIGNHPKMLFPALIIIFVLKSLREKSLNAMLIMAGLSAVLFITIFPAVLLTAGIVCVIALRRGHLRQDTASLSSGGLALVLSLGYLFTFYKLKGTLLAGSNSGLKINAQYLKTAFHIIAGGAFQFYILAPFIVIAVILAFRSSTGSKGKKTRLHRLWQQQKKRYDILFLILLPIAGLLIWGALYPLSVDSVQFFSNVFIATAGIGACVVLIAWATTITLGRTLRITIPTALTALCITANYQYRFQVRSVSKADYMIGKQLEEDPHTSVAMASLRSAKDFPSIFTLSTHVYFPLDFLAYLRRHLNVVSLNTAAGINTSLFAPYQKQAAAILRDAPFQHYVLTEDEDANPFRFCNNYHLNHLCISPDTMVPPVFAPAIKDSIVFNSGWKIYQLCL